MMASFTSERHERIFRDTLSCLRHLGYRGELLQEGYCFNDCFAPGNPLREAPTAAFGETPLSYDSACFAVLLPDRRPPPTQILDYRALGAPSLWRSERTAWCIGVWPATPHRFERSASSSVRLGHVLREEAEQWRPREVMRAKNISLRSEVRQLDFH